MQHNTTQYKSRAIAAGWTVFTERKYGKDSVIHLTWHDDRSLHLIATFVRGNLNTERFTDAVAGEGLHLEQISLSPDEDKLLCERCGIALIPNECFACCGRGYAMMREEFIGGYFKRIKEYDCHICAGTGIRRTIRS